MKKIFVFAILISLFAVSQAQAFDVSGILDTTQDVAQETYVTDGTGSADSLIDVVGAVVDLGIGVLGTLAVILFIYAGFLWMTAGGNEEQIKKAKNIIKAVVVGLIIISIAYALVTFLISKLVSDVPQSRN